MDFSSKSNTTHSDDGYCMVSCVTTTAGKQILHPQLIEFPANAVTAILGPSGSGYVLVCFRVCFLFVYADNNKRADGLCVYMYTYVFRLDSLSVDGLDSPWISSTTISFFLAEKRHC